MLIWSLFLLVTIFLCFFSTYEKIPLWQRRVSLVLLVIFVSFFSGFRDNLGSDYIMYFNKMRGTAYLNFGIEPLFTIFARITNYTIFSPVLFMLVCAIITNALFIPAFLRYNYPFIILLIYFLTPLFYFDTMNAVRQMFAASLFLYSCKYIEQKEFFKFSIFILIAFTMHYSAIFLIPVYFLANRNYNKILLAAILLTSYILGTLITIDFNAFFLKYLPHYAVYTYRDTTHSGSGLLNLIFNLLLLVLIVKKDQVSTSPKKVIALNLFFAGIVIYNFMPSFYYISRLAMYFIVFGAIAIPFLIEIFNRKLMQQALALGFLMLFVYFLAVNSDQKTVIPEKILPLRSLFDPFMPIFS